jgi:glycosyltransferase involved in cell wall biosynthesis
MERPTLHVIGLPHTVVNGEFSHCAFTGKVLRFPKMLQPFGWRLVEYSNEGSVSGADTHVTILTREELARLSKRRSPLEDYSADLDGRNRALVDLFFCRLEAALRARVAPGDIVCHVFGFHPQLAALTPQCYQVESGIGYTGFAPAAPYRVYESSAWMHWHLGRREVPTGRNYEFVAPNYYDLADWEVSLAPGGRDGRPFVLFFGRITSQKGIDVIVEVALRLPETRFILCGQGDPAPWLGRAPNIEALPPVAGRERSTLLGSASVVIAPTVFIEPFCGAVVEAQLCGTPVVTTNYGAFCETVRDGVTGYRCNTLADFVEAVKRAPLLDRARIAERARRKYSLETVGKTYHEIFTNIAALRGKGWYSRRSAKFPREGTDDYDESFHAAIEDEEAPQAARLAAYIAAHLKPGSVRDYGCSSGLYVKALKAALPAIADEVAGYDSSETAIARALCAGVYLCDLRDSGSIASIAPQVSPVGPRLGVCLEVLEHVPEEDWAKVLGTITAHSDLLIFSAAVPGQGGEGHVSCHPKSVWVSRFAGLGWEVDEAGTAALLDHMASGPHMGWFTQNAMLLTKKGPARDD